MTLTLLENKRLAVFVNESIMLTGIHSWFNSKTDWKIEFQAKTVEESNTLINRLQTEATKESPVVALVDISFKSDFTQNSATIKQYYGFEIVRSITQTCPFVRCIIYSSCFSGFLIEKALSPDIGARGFVSKNAHPTELLRAIETVSNDGKYIETDLITNMFEIYRLLMTLTRREREILELAISGFRTSEIANIINRKNRTVESHLNHIYTKIGVSSINDLFVKLGLN